MKNCGSSSRLVRLRNRPIGVTRGSPRRAAGAARLDLLAAIHVHRAELQHLDRRIVEAVASLPEEHRAWGADADQGGDRQHDGCRQHEHESGDDPVLDTLGEPRPSRERAVEHPQQRHAGDLGHAVAVELEAGQIGTQAHVHGQVAELLEAGEATAGRVLRQGDDDLIDVPGARELGQIVERTDARGSPPPWPARGCGDRRTGPR